MTAQSEFAPATAAPASRAGYAARWRTLPRELGYLLSAFPLAVGSMVAMIFLVSVGVSLLILVPLGVVFCLAAFETARWFGEIELRRLEHTTGQRIPTPPWREHAAVSGRMRMFKRLRIMITDPHRWSYLLHALVISPALVMITWTITLTTLALAVAGVLYPLFSLLMDRSTGLTRTDWTTLVFPDSLGLHPMVLMNVANVLLGLIALALLPLIARGLVALHRAVAQAMLSRFASDDLVQRVETLDAARTAAVEAESSGLRRLERDLHDGPQQRLIRLQMDLAASERALSDNPERAGELLIEARAQAASALAELRALSRGMVPPLLQDRGLVQALESMTAGMTPPTTVRAAPHDLVPLSEPVELGAYYVASELLTNIARHSGASRGELILDTSTDGLLIVRAWDNGTGGAHPAPGHGLAGLEARVRALDGALTVSSPEGGPTLIEARIPRG